MTVIECDLSDVASAPVTGTITVRARPDRATGNTWTTGDMVRIPIVDGKATLPLVAGPALLRITTGEGDAGWSKTLDLVVPDDGTHQLTDLIDLATVWDPPVVQAAQAAATLAESAALAALRDADRAATGAQQAVTSAASATEDRVLAGDHAADAAQSAGTATSAAGTATAAATAAEVAQTQVAADTATVTVAVGQAALSEQSAVAAASQGEGSAGQAETAMGRAESAAATTAADRTQTTADRTQTGLDRTASAASATAADLSETAAQSAATNAAASAQQLEERTGTGTPEGVVTATVGTVYTDTAATNGAIRWIKTAGTGNTGWKVQFGDTGWRTLHTPAIPPDWGTISSGNFIRARREGSVIWIVLNGFQRATDDDARVVLTLPVGFRPPAGVSNVPLANRDTYGSYMQVSVAANGALSIYRLPDTGRHYGQFQFVTDQAWPTTLPGTPA